MMTLALLAQAGAPAATGGFGTQILLLYLLLGVAFYVFMIRPQRQKQKQHQALIESLQAGDRVVTTGGLIGTIVKTEKDSLRLRLAPSVEVSLLRGHVLGKAPEESA